MALTKHREGDGWRVHKDGRQTAIVITKGLPPKFGNPQMWDVCDDDDFLFEAKSLSVAMSTIERFEAALNTSEG